jgi:hypothetical protein
MEVVMHILGTCGDAHAHLDLLDIFLMGGAFTTIGVYAKYNWRRFKSYINGWFK